ncbi:hypothetical protein ACET3Z_027114 [Daucus carota]
MSFVHYHRGRNTGRRQERRIGSGFDPTITARKVYTTEKDDLILNTNFQERRSKKSLNIILALHQQMNQI